LLVKFSLRSESYNYCGLHVFYWFNLAYMNYIFFAQVLNRYNPPCRLGAVVFCTGFYSELLRFHKQYAIITIKINVIINKTYVTRDLRF
jgi:hypothetical protein